MDTKNETKTMIGEPCDGSSQQRMSGISSGAEPRLWEWPFLVLIMILGLCILPFWIIGRVGDKIINSIGMIW